MGPGWLDQELAAVINDLKQRAAFEAGSSHQAGGDRTLDRRHFLRAAVGTSTAALAAASPIGTSEAQAYDPGREESRGRYRQTDHVKAYYRTNGYETLKK
jgi:hypothetical protein